VQCVIKKTTVIKVRDVHENEDSILKLFGKLLVIFCSFLGYRHLFFYAAAVASLHSSVTLWAAAYNF
jgi:hypothetical protein